MKLVAFDFDGTLSDSEMTVLLGEQYDREMSTQEAEKEHQSVAGQMEAITEQAMNGEIVYAESLQRRCALLAGLSTAQAKKAFDRVHLRPGAADVLSALDAAGVYTAILTGGFERGVETALERDGVGVETVIANRLAMVDDELTGEVAGPLIEGTKDDALEVLCATVGVDLSETVAVGDGANDLPMLEAAGLAVGFAPKPAVEPACDVVVESMEELIECFESENVLY